MQSNLMQKVALCRALILRKDNLGEWELIIAINALRNEVAHNLKSSERDKKLARVKEIHFRESGVSHKMNDKKRMTDSTIVLYACAHCLGFLAKFESDSKAFRRLVHSLDRTLNKDQPEFEP